MKGDIHLDAAQKEHEIYSENQCDTKAFLWLSLAFFMPLDSVEIAIVDIQIQSDQLAIRLRPVGSSSDLFALWTDRHGSLCKGVNRRRSWRS